MINSLESLTFLRVRCHYLLLIAGLVLAAAAAASAQAPGSSRGLSSGDGNHTIQGRIFFPPGQVTTGRTVKVRLEATNGEGASTVTDQDGSFRFNSVRAGNYSVVVDGGKDFETAREPVYIDPGGTSGPISAVTIHLRPKMDASNPAFAGVPQSALNFYQQGTAAAQKGDAKSAVDLLGKAVAAYPNFSQALSDLGMQYMKLNQMDKAAESFEALLKLNPGDATGQLNLGIALYNEGVALMGQQKLDEAEKKFNGSEAHLREAVKLNSPGPAAHYYLGMMLIKFKAYEEAQKELQLAISNGGDGLALAHKYLGGVYISTKKNKEAADELEKYLKLDPKAADADRVKNSIKELRSKP